MHVLLKAFLLALIRAFDLFIYACIVEGVLLALIRAFDLFFMLRSLMHFGEIWMVYGVDVF